MSNTPGNTREQLCKSTLQEYVNYLGFFQMLIHHIPAGNTAEIKKSLQVQEKFEGFLLLRL